MYATLQAALDDLGRGTGFGIEDIARRLVYKSGADTPANTSTVPEFVGQFYLDTANNKWYLSKGTSAASDFLILN